MQSENRLFDDFVKVMNGAAGTIAGMGREAVRVISASMSASHHMLSAAAAPAPKAMHSTAVKPSTGLIATGAAIRPHNPVNTTRLITRGLVSASRSRQSAGSGSAKGIGMLVI